MTAYRADPGKESAARRLVTAWTKVDPHAAVGEIPLLGLTTTQDLYTSAFRTWCQSNPDAATAFLRQVPAASRDSAIMGIIGHALSRGNDLALAERMYDRLTSDDIRRQAAATLSRTRAIAEAATNPKAAWQRALSIEPGQSRNQTLWSVSQSWFGLDPDCSPLGVGRRFRRQTTGDMAAAVVGTMGRDRPRSGTSVDGVATAFHGTHLADRRGSRRLQAKDSPAEMLTFADTLDAKARREVARRRTGGLGKSRTSGGSRGS